MDDHELEQTLRLLAAERVQPGPELLLKTKARLRRSRLIPWLLAASVASQVGSVIGSYWLLFVFQADWLFKALWLSGLAATAALPLVLLALRLPEQNWPLNRA
ncbi:MAG TPA: hypothetical protein VMZ49_04355 [Patescibacteria group bacterium]|nr:hypothetical protein [Patescibacteria group bacterium]